jgi:hypothetical protein
LEICTFYRDLKEQIFNSYGLLSFSKPHWGKTALPCFSDDFFTYLKPTNNGYKAAATSTTATAISFICGNRI